MKNLLIHFGIIFVITLVTCAVVTFFYGFIVYGKGVVGWDISVLLAIILGIVLPIHRALLGGGE